MAPPYPKPWTPLEVLAFIAQMKDCREDDVEPLELAGRLKHRDLRQLLLSVREMKEMEDFLRSEIRVLQAKLKQYEEGSTPHRRETES